MARETRRVSHRPRRDAGRLVALTLCVVFALIGAVPLALGALVRAAAVREWAAREVSALLARELGFDARFDVRVHLWPVELSLSEITVDASDGGAPFLAVERASLRPRLFSLLAGELHAGEVEIVAPRVRAVVKGGELANLALSLPEGGPSRSASAPAPFTSVSITDARLEVTLDGAAAVAEEVDLDVSAEPDGALEVAVRTGRALVTRVHPTPGREAEEDMVDEDAICRLEARARVEAGSVLVRRLALLGSVDLDPDPGTRPSCSLPARDWRALELRASALRVTLPDEGAPAVRGHVRARIPAGIAHRFVDLPYASGSLLVDADVSRDEKDALPEVRGSIHADDAGIDGKLLARDLDASVSIAGGVVHLADLDVRWADGQVRIAEVELEPLAPGKRLMARGVEIHGVEFTGLLRDLSIHPRAHVTWTLAEGRAEHFGGTLDPLRLEGPLALKTRDFEVFDRPVVDPTRRHMVGVREAALRGTFIVRPNTILLSRFSIDTPRSHLTTTVDLDLREIADIEVFAGSVVDLADISPVAGVTLGGKLSLAAKSRGPFSVPDVDGTIGVEGFTLAGFSVGDIESAKVGFVPLVLTLEGARLRKGQSRLTAPAVRVAFDEGADVSVDADVDTREAPGLSIRDLLSVFKFDKDPRFEEIEGVAAGTARVRYALGGREDRCGGGYLKVATRMDLERVRLFSERYDRGRLDLDFEWDDQEAGDAGMNVDVRSAALHKGDGTVLANATIRHGARVSGSILGTGLPLDRVDALGPLGKQIDGQASFVATLSGTLDALESVADVTVSRVRIGPDTLPPSRLRVAMESVPPKPGPPGRTRCGGPRRAPFDPAELARDLSDGQFRSSGQLFDGQVVLDDVRFTRQRSKVVAGRVSLRRLDLGTLSNLLPGVAFAAARPSGALAATIDVRRLPLERLGEADVAVDLTELTVARGESRATLTGTRGPLRLAGDELTVPGLHARLRTGSGLAASVLAEGSVRRVATSPELDLGVALEPLELGALVGELEDVARASGSLSAALRVTGPAAAPAFAGSARLRGGEIDLKSPRLAIDGIEIDAEAAGGEVRVTRAVANVGAGKVAMKARVPIRGLSLGELTASITARGVNVPVAEGVELTSDADLAVTYDPAAKDEDGVPLAPLFEGTVALTSFSYTRPISLNVDLGRLAGKAQRTEVEATSPDRAALRFRVSLVSPRPLRFSNNLFDMQLAVDDPGLLLSGTSREFGARGRLRVLEDSKLRLRNHEFEVREGAVRFDDPDRIAPTVDLRAVTEYRRYASTAPTGAEAASEPGSGGAAGAATAGQWRITLHAQGDVDDLKVDFTSDPPLGQEDIVLLLTFGTTRAELDRGLATSLGETVGLEALSALTGADKAVKTIVPIIDDFRLGTAYSSRSGRVEPTVTLGKRVTDDVRATVTTGLSESREVRSSVEWRLNRKMSVLGSYDNANDASSSSVGNVGADLRLRLEFE
jgi:translocation and assembly module TamB